MMNTPMSVGSSSSSNMAQYKEEDEKLANELHSKIAAHISDFNQYLSTIWNFIFFEIRKYNKKKILYKNFLERSIYIPKFQFLIQLIFEFRKSWRVLRMLILKIILKISKKNFWSKCQSRRKLISLRPHVY